MVFRVALVLLLLVSSARADDAWRAFHPLVLAAGEGDQPRAVAYLRSVNRVLRKLEGNLERDAPTQRFYEAATESYEELDLRGLMKLLPEQDGQFRRFAVQGQESTRAYLLSAPQGPSFEVNSTSKRRGFGESSSVLRMRHIEEGDGKRYLVQWRSGVGLGDVRWDSLVRGASDAISLVEENVQRPSEDTRPLALRTADASLKKAQPQLGAEDRRVLATAWTAFPELARTLTALGSIDDVIDLPRSNGLARLRMVSHFDLKRMEQSYPELADYLDDFGDLIEIKVQLRDANDNTLADVWLDSGRMLARVEAYLRDGALVPSRAGKPLLDAAPDFRRMEAHVHVHAHAVGIHMYVDDLRIELAYAPTGMLTTRVRHTPGFRVEGRALGLFPASMLDWFIPGDIPGLARRMFDIATKGNDGQGVVLDWRFATQDELATLDVRAGVEVLDTVLIRFGMKIAADRVIPDDAQSADLRKLWVASRDAFARDLERFARYGNTPPHILQPF